MTPLPHRGAAPLRPSFQQIQSLLDAKQWTDAKVRLEELRESVFADPLSFDFGVWSLLRSRMLVLSANFRDAIDSGRQSLAALERSAADDYLGDAHDVLGLSYLGVGDTKNALIHVRDALAIYRRMGDHAGLVRAHNDLARVCFVRGEHGAAIEHLADALETARLHQIPEREAMLLGNLGRVYLLQGRWTEAEAALTEAHSRALGEGNWLSAGRNLLSLGYLSTLRHDFKIASVRLDAALTAIEKVGLPRERAIYFEYSAWLQFEQKHWIAAKEAFRRSLELGRRISTHNDLVSQSLRGLAECEAALGDWPEAARLAREGLDVAILIGERAEVGCLYRVLARTLAHLGDNEESHSTLVKAGECLDAVGDLYESARLALARAEVLTILNPKSPLPALCSLDEAGAIFNRLGATDQLVESRWKAIELKRDQGMIAEALVAAREAVSTATNPMEIGESQSDVLSSIADLCVNRALSSDNEFRLSGTPWAGTAGDEVQSTIEFVRQRLNASRAVLLEVTSNGKRSGRSLAVAGATVKFAHRLGELAANPFQSDLRTDRPTFFWSAALAPQLAAHLGHNGDAPPLSVITVPIELGPESSGLLYVDIQSETDRAGGSWFNARDLEFAVAYGEVVAWRSTKLRSEGLLRDVQRLRDQLGRESEFPSIITQNPEFKETLSRIRLIVDSDVSVLLSGETGTGKDLLARAIHYSSQRRDHRFVSVNCAALPETLLESELFGVRRGAFTGADRDKVGLFEEADGGTFFLDEIGEMPLSIQAKLLRLLESKELTRLGDTKPRRVDVRVISATNRDLSVEMERNAFRRDLFYRLTPVSFHLPALRDRREDVPLLIEHFLGELEAEGRSVRFSAEALRVLSAHDWPGNVRELENEVRKTVLLSEPGLTIAPDQLSRKFTVVRPTIEDTRPGMPERFSLYDHIAQLERHYIVQALNDANGVKKHAATRLGIPESTLRLKMKQYSLDGE